MGHIKVARWTYYTGNFIDNTVNLCCLWGIFKNRHLSNATGRIRDESLINQGGREKYIIYFYNGRHNLINKEDNSFGDFFNEIMALLQCQKFIRLCRPLLIKIF
jgi:hypothetical protein